MKREREFTLDAPLERTCDVLLDIRPVTSCLAGAQMTGAGAAGVPRG